MAPSSTGLPETSPGASVYQSYGTTIFTVMSSLAADVDAINLGQGFPDEDGPEDIRRITARAVMDGPNQYPPMMGLPQLRQAVADHDQRFYGLDFDWQSQVMVTSGATEALTDCILGLVNPGDEVILIEPVYDSYLPMIERAGGIPRVVQMTPPDWSLPIDDLAAAFSDKTKLIMLNSPHNPTGKVFSRDELSAIAELVIAHDAYAICDEVYEHLVFGDAEHLPLMTFPGMVDRCLRIGSAGKTFSLTGWKIGYISGPPALIDAAAKAHQFNTFTTATPLQLGVAHGLGKGDPYFKTLAYDMTVKRDILAKGLQGIGLRTSKNDGTYFITADIAGLAAEDETDLDFCRRITAHAGVAAVPVSAFYRSDRPAPTNMIRFCFCKKTDVLGEAIGRLAAYFG